MFKFENILFLWALAIIPLIVMLFWYFRSKRKKALQNFASARLIEILMPGISKTKPAWRMFFLCLSLTSIIVAAAGPQVGTKLEEVKREGVDLMICIDVSKSMLAEDFKPNRLKRAKRAIQKLVDNLRADRIGMVVFAGEAFVQLPITTDYSAAKLFLDHISTDMVSTQGTAISDAINLSVNSFSEDSEAGKAIIIIGDGEDHEGGAEDAAREAREKGITVHTIGFGSIEGAPIPVYRGKQQIGYVKDKSGQTVITKLNPKMLENLADAGGGKYVRATNTDSGLGYIFDEIGKMETAEFQSEAYTDYENRFQYLLALSLLSLIAYRTTGVKRNRLTEKLKDNA